MAFLQDLITLQFHGFLKTPPLWIEPESFEIPQYFTDLQPVPALKKGDISIPERCILGKRVEFFFSHYIRNSSKEELLLEKKVISKEKITLGEIDFLLRNKVSGAIMHVELVYKFYLYLPKKREELERWIGPNRKDSLIRKLDRLKNHQLPLLFREESRVMLKDRNIVSNFIDQRVCFKAHLFVPFELLSTPIPLVNNACIAGYWISREKFCEAAYGTFLFYTPEKQNWLIEPENCREWFCFRDILPQLNFFLENKRSPLIWMKRNDEYIRFFLVWW